MKSKSFVKILAFILIITGTVFAQNEAKIKFEIEKIIPALQNIRKHLHKYPSSVTENLKPQSLLLKSLNHSDYQYRKKQPALDW